MKGDFSRDSFNRLNNFRRVLMQQGRLQLDADWNEQISILLHYMQALAADIIGPYAGPDKNCGFAIEPKADSVDFIIGKGRYYVDGILCENNTLEEISYLNQPDLPKPPELTSGKSYVVYLDLWERHITYIENDDIRELALGGADTTTRTKAVWQVKVKELIFPPYYCLYGAGLLDKEIVISEAYLRARAKREQELVEPCLVEPEAKYRGPENQLYRVEVHGSSFDTRGQYVQPTFKWSRENGSVAFPIKRIKSNGNDTVTVELENLGRNDNFDLAVNDWVEIEDDAYVLEIMAKPLLQVLKKDLLEMTVTLKKKAELSYFLDRGLHPLLRRWDQKKDVTENGVLEIKEGNGDEDAEWLELENGVKIQFKPGGTYRTGDYWLIPARIASGDIEWPEDAESKPKFLPPRGVIHRLAPLAIISVNSSDSVTVTHDCRCKFKSLSDNCSYSYYGQLGAGIGVDLLYPE